jgi:hypothetical protein
MKTAVERTAIVMAWRKYRYVFDSKTFAELVETTRGGFHTWFVGNYPYMNLSNLTAAKIKIINEYPLDRWEFLFKVAEAKYEGP